MSATTTSSSAMFSDDFVLGSRVIGYALRALSFGISLAIAWSCSTLMLGIIMFIIMSIVMYLLSMALHVVLLFKLPTESIGHTVGGAAARVRGLFDRKVAA